MDKFEEIEKPRKKIFVDNFIGGIAWALGATFGLAFIIALLWLVLRHINLIPYFGNFVANIIEFVITKNPNLLPQ